MESRSKTASLFRTFWVAEKTFSRILSAFIAEVKSDLMGEQTILCGMLPPGTIVCYVKMIEEGMKNRNKNDVISGED